MSVASYTAELPRPGGEVPLNDSLFPEALEVLSCKHGRIEDLRQEGDSFDAEAGSLNDVAPEGFRIESLKAVAELQAFFASYADSAHPADQEGVRLCALLKTLL